MNIPSFIKTKISNQDGHPTDEFIQIFNQLFSQLQNNLSDEGYKVPQQNTSTITELNTQGSIGALIYDNETHQLKININGIFKVVQVI